MSDRASQIAIVGAAGFVGQELLRQLELSGLPATAIIRGIPELAVNGAFHTACRDLRELRGRRFDCVINLAYPTSGLFHDYPRMDAEIVDTVTALAAPGGHVVHASSLAVFGFTLDRPIVVGPISPRRDEAYVESKVEIESALTELQRRSGGTLDIVRFGNVWGAGSGAWTMPMLHRLITARPVAVRGRTGYSNATDVANAASYLTHLVAATSGSAGVRYHHLAELSSTRWLELCAPIAEELGVSIEVAESGGTVGKSVHGDIIGVLAPGGARQAYWELGATRIAGSWTRSFLRALPPRVHRSLKGEAAGLIFAESPPESPAESLFLAMVAADTEFRSVVDPEWSAPLTVGASVQRVLDWMNASWSPARANPARRTR